jgi:hypothetical protein
VASSVDDDLGLRGWDVLAVGQRQAWPFVTFAAPTDERSERTLWIDTDFAVADGAGHELVGTALVIGFDDGSSLAVSNAPNARDSQGWWLGRSTQQ